MKKILKWTIIGTFLTVIAVGVAWGLTYKEICVIGNIYLEAGICLLSALWLTWRTIKA